MLCGSRWSQVISGTGGKGDWEFLFQQFGHFQFQYRKSCKRTAVSLQGFLSINPLPWWPWWLLLPWLALMALLSPVALLALVASVTLVALMAPMASVLIAWYIVNLSSTFPPPVAMVALMAQVALDQGLVAQMASHPTLF